MKGCEKMITTQDAAYLCKDSYEAKVSTFPTAEIGNLFLF